MMPNLFGGVLPPRLQSDGVSQAEMFRRYHVIRSTAQPQPSLIEIGQETNGRKSFDRFSQALHNIITHHSHAIIVICCHGYTLQEFGHQLNLPGAAEFAAITEFKINGILPTMPQVQRWPITIIGRHSRTDHLTEGYKEIVGGKDTYEKLRIGAWLKLICIPGIKTRINEFISNDDTTWRYLPWR
eukprot:PhF_6_TR14201/c0_g1_i1/m.22750